MGAPKKPAKKKPIAKATGAKKSADEELDPKPKKKIVDDDDDDEFDEPLDELGSYESFDGFEEDDDY
jgi:hypothetical protein